MDSSSKQSTHSTDNRKTLLLCWSHVMLRIPMEAVSKYSQPVCQPSRLWVVLASLHLVGGQGSGEPSLCKIEDWLLLCVHLERWKSTRTHRMQGSARPTHASAQTNISQCSACIKPPAGKNSTSKSFRHRGSRPCCASELKSIPWCITALNRYQGTGTTRLLPRIDSMRLTRNQYRIQFMRDKISK